MFDRRRDILRLPLKALRFLAVLPICVVLRLLEPWRRIRIGWVPYHSHIGELAGRPEILLRRKALSAKGEHTCLDILLVGPPANRQLLTMLRRRLLILEFGRGWRTAKLLFDNLLLPVLGRFVVPLDFRNNEYREFNEAPAQLRFLPAEEERGLRLLEEMGVPAGAPFVCFHARDSSYYERSELSPAERSELSLRARRSAHRDCDVGNYLAAAEWLASEGLFVLRMGHVVERPIGVGHPRVIDYATRFRSDFGDIFLATHCKFFLGCTAGLFVVPTVLNVPVAGANFIYMGLAPFRLGDVFIPKKYWDLRRERFLTYPEIIPIETDLWESSSRYVAKNIQPVQNTADEILALAREMNARLDGTWQPQSGDEELQQRYRAMFPKEHPHTGFPSRVGAQFVRDNAHLLGSS